MAPRKVSIPGQGVPIQVGNAINPDWYLVLKYLETLSPLSDIPAIVTPAPLTPGNTTVSVTNRTVTDSLNSGAGTDSGNIGYALSGQSLYDSFTVIKNVINSFNTNHTNSKNAIDALNTRVTALENKVNAIIASIS